jgi:hypothetical protein
MPQAPLRLQNTKSPGRPMPGAPEAMFLRLGAENTTALSATCASDEKGKAFRIASAAGVSSIRAYSSTGPIVILILRTVSSHYGGLWIFFLLLEKKRQAPPESSRG